MNILKKCLLAAAGLCFASSAFATPITVTFDTAVADYTPTPGVVQHVTNEFAALGFIFQDAVNPQYGATLGKCGPGEGAVALFGYGNNGSCGNYTPNLNILFVDPTDASNKAFTTSFSIMNYDGLIQMTAYDEFDNVLGATQLYQGLLSLSDIGQIYRINLLSLDNDPTTLDTMTFGSVTPNQVQAQVPEPTSIALIGMGLIGLSLTRRKAKA